MPASGGQNLQDDEDRVWPPFDISNIGYRLVGNCKRAGIVN